MKFGFPADEVKPETCEPYGPDFNDIYNIIRNDAMGNISLTLVDNLDSLIVMEEWEELENSLRYLEKEQDNFFRKDTIVQVFETSIRSLGGLLSCHLLITDFKNHSPVEYRYQRLKEIADSYNGFLLNMAYDLGLRLLPAYKTSTNIPLPRINLLRGLQGVPLELQREQCLSGATTPMLEFTLLSRLTGNPEFERYSQSTFWKLWFSRLKLDLLPMSIDSLENTWRDDYTGIGASVDSFYEYAVKSSILFNDEYMWSVFKKSYKALLIHLVQAKGESDGSMIFGNINVNDGMLSALWIDLLGAFWPGLQVLAGQVNSAIETHLVYMKLWDYFELIPERWAFISPLLKDKLNTGNASIFLEWYPLRPEFIESTYYLYRSNRDPMYLQIGARILEVLRTKYSTKCGLRGLQDIRYGSFQNRMETFVMSETLKYLLLLFDIDDQIFLHSDMMKKKNWIFSTEAHPLWYDESMKASKKMSDIEYGAVDEIFELKELWLRTLFLKVGVDSRKLYDLDTNKLNDVATPEVKHPNSHKLKKLPWLRLVDYFEDKLSVCESSSFRNTNGFFMVSGYYSWQDTFKPDKIFKSTLFRPHYLLLSSLDGSYFEISPSFFNVYGFLKKLSDNDLFLQCPRLSTTMTYEVILGDIKGISDMDVFIFKATEHPRKNGYPPILENDLWIPKLYPTRMRFEKLEPGAIDSFNRIIPQEYIQSIRIDDFNLHGASPTNKIEADADKTSAALRLKKVNGIRVPPNLVVWTSSLDILNFFNSPTIKITSDGRVKIQGYVIENLFVYNL